MGSKKQTIGYHYLMALLSGLWRGPVNEVIEIKVGDKTAWSGNAVDATMRVINQPNLFGGEKKEGGIQGAFRLFMGAKNQVLPGAANFNPGSPIKSRTLPDVQQAVGGQVSEFRGVVTFWFYGLISSMNPYPKEWKFRGRRTTAGWYNNNPWYPAKCRILLEGGVIHAMNPAHIIYECVTNPEWGRGLAANRINENSFIYSANTFCDELFGLCLTWFRKQDIEEFVQSVLDHCGAVLYTDRETGLLTLRPIRADYDSDEIPVFTLDSGLLDILEDDSGSQDGAYSEVIVTGKSPISGNEFEMRAQNPAAWQEHGAANTLAVKYPGLPTAELGMRVAQRDLKVHASGLKKFRVLLDRRAWRVAPGSVFKVVAPHRGIASIILRAGEIQDGSLTDGKITIAAAEDVFGMPDTASVPPIDSSWTPPVTEAMPPPVTYLTEAGYRDVFLKQGQSDAEGLKPGDSLILQMAVAPNATTMEYELWSRAEGEADYESRATGFFTGTATTVSAIGPLATSVTFTADQDLDEEIIGDAILIGDELVQVTAYNTGTKVATIVRGVADTIPLRHPAGTRVWSVDDDAVSDERLYSTGETVYTKVLTRTSSDLLNLAEAAADTVTLEGRAPRPYPPGNYKIDGDFAVLFPDPDDIDPDDPIEEHPEPVLTWSHRDRILQADQLVGHTGASVGPEPGVSYTIRVYADDGITLLRTVADINDTTWTYTNEMQSEDGAPIRVWIELESVRDGLASWKHYRTSVYLKTGWGYQWGLNWGGA